MTILAVRVLSLGAAVVWTDSETLRVDTGEHARYRNKLVATGAGVVCVAGGWDALADEADRVACMARDIHHAARVVPERLRQACMRLVRGQARDPREIARQVVILAGWSAEWGRVVAYRLSGPAFFEPVLTTAECVPDVPEFTRLREPVPEHVVRVAQAQMDALRVDYPAATGGPLAMAVIQPRGVTIGTIHDLSADIVEQLPNAPLLPIEEVAA